MHRLPHGMRLFQTTEKYLLGEFGHNSITCMHDKDLHQGREQGPHCAHPPHITLPANGSGDTDTIGQPIEEARTSRAHKQKQKTSKSKRHMYATETSTGISPEDDCNNNQFDPAAVLRRLLNT